MKTLILDNFDSFTYNLFQYCAELGGNPEVYRNNKITIDEIEKNNYSHIIISPGPGSPEKKRDFGICGKVIRHFAGKIPVLGVCLGHQGIIAEFGGKILRAPEPVHGKSSLIRIHAKHRLFKGLPETIEGMRYHSLIGKATSIPKEFEIISETVKDHLVMGISHRDFQLFGLQFHPESIGTPYGKRILENFLRCAEVQKSLNEHDAEILLTEIAAQKFSETETIEILQTLASRGETVSEIVGMAKGLLKLSIPFPFSDEELMDNSGTGGSGLLRMNISTTVAFVLAACGVKIAKHGNRAATGKSGSFDLLEALGVNIKLPPEAVKEAIQRFGIGFLFAPLFHPAMQHIAPVRKKIPGRTIFNLLGPLVNPAKPAFHFLGTTSRETAEKIINAMKKLSYKHTMVVTGENGLDDVIITGKTFIYELHKGKIRKSTFSPEEAGMKREKELDISAIGTPEKNAKLFMELLENKAPRAFQNFLLLNVAFGLIVRGFAKDVFDGIAKARKAIESGAALKKFLAYKKFSNVCLP